MQHLSILASKARRCATDNLRCPGLPSGIAVDRDGNMYVSDSDNWRMIELAPEGTPVDQVAARPLGVTADGSGE